MWPARETLPPLDCHAHIAPDVTLQQVAGLEGAQVFAMTRTLAQAALVGGRRDLGLVWGLGVHPGDPVARAAFDVATLTGLLDRFTLIGEIGLDRRGGDLARQQQIFDEILSSVRGHPVLLSLHSTGAIDEVLDVLTQRSGRGAILHWFTGNASQVGRAAALGCYFSVNAAMSDEQLARIPPDRMLPETDFPSSRQRTGAQRPGDLLTLETRLETVRPQAGVSVRRQLYRNLRELAITSGAIERLPEQLVDLLLVA
jgi:TatD DNase family protein